jgi:hypothetical protein
MTTSNTTTFDLSIDDLIEEAFERCGIRGTNGYQLKSARRSLNLLFLDWANRGLNLWTIEQATYALVQGNNEISLATDTVNVLSAVIRDPSQGILTDITIDRISRSEYLNIPDKTSQARPAQYYVQRTNVPRCFSILRRTRTTRLCTTGFAASKMLVRIPTHQTSTSDSCHA